MINNKGNLEAQIEMLKGKIHAAIQEIMVETGNKEFHRLRMEAVRQLMEATIIPIITYGSVAWEQKKNGTTRNDIQQSPKNHPPPTTADANKHPTSRNRKYPYGINNQEEKTNARQQNNNKQNRGLVQITTDGDSI